LEHPSRSFDALDERIQRFIWESGWIGLRDAQEKAIPAVLRCDSDVIIAAATAEGKTEAAFFPALTYALQQDEMPLIVYVGPLKALINDQFQRLSLLCDRLEIPVHPWHGDIGASVKSRFLKTPAGVLLITPESLEATLCARGTAIGRIFERASFVIVDEMHAFMGSERGKQLQSQLHRIESVIGRRVPRIGLSATLGDMNAAATYLRPGFAKEVAMIVSTAIGSELKVLVKGYEEPLVNPKDEEAELPEAAPSAIAEHMFKVLRGSNNLVFPNSRKAVEGFTHLLSRMSDSAGVPNEFWPHHGSLSKEIRSEAESALKQGERPATAICTNTLELGIDIGSVHSVVQVGCPPSVASLRQRLGRSGRRKGEPAILRCYQVEDALQPSSPLNAQLRMRTLQTAAMISLLADKWFEPPAVRGKHLSTLVQQLLSFIAQNGGMTASQGFELFCAPGSPFEGVAPSEFTDLLRHLGKKELIAQDGTGLLLHGATGEKIVNHYAFYAAFASDEEYRVIAGQQTLGSLPISMMIVPGQFILFAGRTWRVDAVDDDSKAIHVSRAGAGVAPPFDSGGGRVHSKVRLRMRELYEGSAELSYLDAAAKKFMAQGRETYSRLELSTRTWTDHGPELMLWTWLGDGTNDALAAILRNGTLVAQREGAGVSITKAQLSTSSVLSIVAQTAASDIPAIDQLLQDARALRKEKWDWALPDHLLRESYASLNLDIAEAVTWLRKANLS
jgi:ATP-dependent Lhr-like helicase